MTPLFVASSGLIKEEGRSCLPWRWFNGPRPNNGATFKTAIGAHYEGTIQREGSLDVPTEAPGEWRRWAGPREGTHRGVGGGRKDTIEVTSRFHLSPVPPHLASRQLGASVHTKGKFSVSGWLKALTLEKTH